MSAYPYLRDRYSILVSLCFFLIISIDKSLSQTVPLGDTAWNAVVAQTKTVPLKYSKNITRTLLAVETEAQAERARNTSALARTFYTQFPTHPKAGEARKIEALFALRGISSRQAAQEESALAVAKAYRINKSNSLADRCEVALAIERMQLSLAVKSHGRQMQGRDYLRIAEELLVEFGERPELYSFLMDVAPSTRPIDALTMAAKVKQSTTADLKTKSKAQFIIEEAALVGKPIALQLTSVDGSIVDLAKSRNRAAIVIVFAPSDPVGIMIAAPLSGMSPRKFDVIYVAVGGTELEALASQSMAPIAGAFCYASKGAVAQRIISSLKLGTSSIPRAYVINKDGLLIGYGREQELVGLIAKAAQ